MIHGLFENATVRVATISSLRRKKGLAASQEGSDGGGDPYDRLATIVRDHVQMDLLRRLVVA
jgi:cobyric acid synthase